MRCPTLTELPPPPPGRTGWPWTEETPAAPERMLNGKPWPCFSITTPSFHQGEFLEETIRSILLQGYPAIELMVIDGGSQDESPVILEKYSPWLTYWVSEPDRGQSHAINKGWERSTGDLICYLNSDDFFMPSALRLAAEAWKWDSSVSIVAGGVIFCDVESQAISIHRPYLHQNSPLDLSLLPPWDWYIPQQSTFWIREHLDKVGRSLREELRFTMDRELMYRMCREGRVLFVGDLLSCDRKQPRSARLVNTLDMYREDEMALEYCTWGTDSDRVQRKQVARWRLGQGHYQYANRAPSWLAALKHYSLAAFYRPRYLRSKGFLKKAVKSVLNHDPTPSA